MGYDENTIQDTRQGFTYDLDELGNLGIVERNGVRLCRDRRNGCLLVERMEPTLETIKQDLERVMGND